MESQTSSRVMMVRPATFYYNSETAENNSFQTAPSTDSATERSEIHRKAVMEFDQLVSLLRGEGVTVEVIEELADPPQSDSVFPNNWMSFHHEQGDELGLKVERIENIEAEDILPVVNRTLVIYPMWSGERQMEREKNKGKGIELMPEGTTILDLSPLEKLGRPLEGTGSLVLDRQNRLAYACLSPRTHRDAISLFCKRMDYRPLVFTGVDPSGLQCYHTNVLMSIADRYCVICLDAIPDLGERVEVEVSLKNSGKMLIPLSMEQMNNFAGNCLQLKGADGTFLVMSSTAFKALTEEQKEMIGQFDKIVQSDVSTIEKYGGGSVRCMIAEFGEGDGAGGAKEQ